MEAKQRTHIEQLKQALRELHANRQHFSRAAFGKIGLVLLAQLRRLQTTAGVTTKSDEIRLVTVMFADVKDSTLMAQHLEASDWKIVIGEFHRRLGALVARWDGQIGQYLGDGVLAFFGAQHSGGDDALRGVSCALAVRAMVEQYAQEVYLQYGIRFATRTGISTGRVVVGMIGSSSKQELLALGPATNLAARLQSIAPAGNIFIDAATHNRIRQHFVTQQQPPQHLKGYDEPVAIYAVLARRVLARTQLTDDTINALPMPLVGRQREMRLLDALLANVIHSRQMHALTILGDVGVGKSRLLQHVLTMVDVGAVKPLVMVAQYEQRLRSHNLLRDLLADICHISDDTPPAEARDKIVAHITSVWDQADDANASAGAAAAAIIGYLADFDFEDSPHVQAIRQGTQDRMAFAWVARWLMQWAQGQPLLLVVDNLQWADPDSLGLLAYLTTTLGAPGGLLLAAARPEFRTEHPAYLQRFSRHQWHDLAHLAPQATSQLIAAILRHVERVPPSLAEQINDRAEGNPLFVQAFLEMLFDHGVFQPIGDKRWRFQILQYDEAMLPNGLLGVLQARLDDLPPAVRQLVQTAAIIGHTFWAGALADLTDLDPRPLLERLVQRGIIVRHADSGLDGDTQYSFSHTLYRDVAYEMMPRAKREVYHRSTAEWLVGRVYNRPEFLALLAEHFEAGGRHDAALFTYLEAALVRLDRGLFNETLNLIDNGLAVARNMPRDVALPTVSRLWTLRARALNELKRFDEASAAAESALRLLNELPRDQLPVERVQSARMLGVAYRSLGRYPQAFEAFQAAYDYLPNEDQNPPLTAEVLRSFGILCLYQGNLDESLAYQQRAYTYAQTSGQDRQVTASMTQLGFIAMERGDMAAALGLFEQVLEINQARAFRHYQMADLRNIGIVYSQLLSYERALAVFDGAASLQAGLGAHDPLLRAHHGLCWVQLGQRDEGFALLHLAAQEDEVQDAYIHHWVDYTLLCAYVSAGEHTEALALADDLAQRVEARNPTLRGRVLLQRGLVYQALGEPSAQTLHAALEMEQVFGGRDLWRIHAALAETTPDPASARAHYAQAADQIRAISTGLHAHRDVQYDFLHHPFIQQMLRAAAMK